MFVLANSHANSDKIGNENDSKTLLKRHHVSTPMFFILNDNLLLGALFY